MLQCNTQRFHRFIHSLNSRGEFHPHMFEEGSYEPLEDGRAMVYQKNGIV